MQKMFAVLGVLALGAALGRFVDEALPRAAAGGGEGGGVENCAAKNGDVNANGAVDLSDAVTILGHLFLGNPTMLVPLCDPRDLTARIQELEAQLRTAVLGIVRRQLYRPPCPQLGKRGALMAQERR